MTLRELSNEIEESFLYAQFWLKELIAKVSDGRFLDLTIEQALFILFVIGLIAFFVQQIKNERKFEKKLADALIEHSRLLEEKEHKLKSLGHESLLIETKRRRKSSIEDKIK